MSIELCVFDMAGTTVDEDNLVYKTLQRMVQKHGYDVTLDQVLEHGAGKEKRQAIEDILVSINVDDASNISVPIFNDFKKELATAYQNEPVKAISGIEETISKLRKHNIQVYLNTGYDRSTAEHLLSRLGWNIAPSALDSSGMIDGLITASDVEHSRPYPDMIQLAITQANISSSERVLKAGDSAIDIEEGKQAGCAMTIGVLTGAQTREQLLLANPTHVLDSLASLDQVLGI